LFTCGSLGSRAVAISPQTGGRQIGKAARMQKM
jgi:hypothetical protein